MRPVMIINLSKCVGCLSCVEACILENIARRGKGGELLLPNNVTLYARTRPVWIRYDHVIQKAFIQCVQCDNPPCVYVCPTGASYMSEEGVVLVDDKRCIRCELCIYACPYNVRTRLKEPFEGKIEHEHALKVGIPDKCTFCYHRKSGEGIWIPACVEACPYGARLFGDFDNPNDPVKQIIETGIALAPREDLRTNPKVFYISRTKGFELIKYPIRNRDKFISYELWDRFKETVTKPLFYITTAIGIIFGIVHMFKARREKGGESSE